MPLKHLRVCVHCERIRFAACSIACRVPDGENPDSWQLNLQDGAGTMGTQVTT